MRIIGIDPSSSISGTAVIDTPDEILEIDHWKRDKTKSHPEGFKSFHFYLADKIFKFRPQMAVIEFGAFRMGGKQGDGGKGNTQALQTVSFYQAVAALSCKLNGLVVIESRASTARKAALGNGALSKDAVWEIMRKQYPNIFSAKTSGGTDECDALVLAKAGPTVAER
jgi:Holliday junction resolvasome RuvABC endonuclease subunit